MGPKYYALFFCIFMPLGLIGTYLVEYLGFDSSHWLLTFLLVVGSFILTDLVWRRLRRR